jgi:hypothetical protein
MDVLCLEFERPNLQTPVRHVASKCDSQRLHHDYPRPESRRLHAVLHGKLERNDNKKITRINLLTYTECQTAQRGRARAVIGSWSEHSWQRRVGWVRIGPEQKRQRRKNRESEKQREKNEQTNKTGVFPRSCRPPGYVKEKWCSQPVSRGARGTADVRVFPNSGWCYGCGHCRGAALLALSVSVRSQRAADATVTAARRCSATIVSVSLEVLTPLRSMIDDVGFSLSRWARSVPASDGIGWWLIHACWFEEPGGS